MATKPKTQVAPALSELITNTLEANGVSIRDLALKLQITYEHARRIVRGEGIPSRYILKELCEFLGLDYAAAEKLAVQQKVRQRYGDTVLEMQGKNPELEPIERAWPKLTPEQQTSVVAMVQAWAKSNKAAVTN